MYHAAPVPHDDDKQELGIIVVVVAVVTLALSNAGQA